MRKLEIQSQIKEHSSQELKQYARLLVVGFCFQNQIFTFCLDIKCNINRIQIISIKTPIYWFRDSEFKSYNKIYIYIFLKTDIIQRYFKPKIICFLQKINIQTILANQNFISGTCVGMNFCIIFSLKQLNLGQRMRAFKICCESNWRRICGLILIDSFAYLQDMPLKKSLICVKFPMHPTAFYQMLSLWVGSNLLKNLRLTASEELLLGKVALGR